MENTCRICLGEGSPTQPLRKRCNCAYFHDECFISFIRHNNRNTCEVCNEPFRGLELTRRDRKVASFKKFINVILTISCCFTVLSWINYNSIKDLETCINNVYYLNKPAYTCVNQITGIKFYTFTVNMNVTVMWVILLIMAACFPLHFGFVIYKSVYYLSLDTGQYFLISNPQNLQFNNNAIQEPELETETETETEPEQNQEPVTNGTVLV